MGGDSSSSSGESGLYTPTVVNYSNYTSAQCFSLSTDQEVICSSQHLNIYDPPSIYNYPENTPLWEPVTCLLYNVTLDNRINMESTFNFCTVPERGYDTFLFASLALIVAALLNGKLGAVWCLIAGGIIGVINYYANLLQISSSIALWLSIQPADLFFYAFLPPLLLDSALKIDFFLLRKARRLFVTTPFAFSHTWIHAIMLAFIMVILAAILVPVFVLFVMGFDDDGWSWVYGALLAAIIAPTDALAVGAVLAKISGPRKAIIIMEGESLFNDASAITLFEVFAHLIYEHAAETDPVWPSVWSVIPTIITDILRLSSIGLALGLAFSLVTGYLLGWLRWRGAKPYVETTFVLAMAYLTFYVTNSPCRGSGVIAVVIFGLYGNATSKWGMLSVASGSGGFDATWDMISFAANGLVFFWSGISSVNFFIRSVQLLARSAWSYAAIPLLYVAMIIIRTGCLFLFNPIFVAIGEGLNWREILFVGWSGLRGSVSLIMVSAFISGSSASFAGGQKQTDIVNADIGLWSSAFVLLTLIINGPLIGTVVKALKLDSVPLEKLKMHAKAHRALGRFTDEQLSALKEDEDEFLQGANWDAVAVYVEPAHDESDQDKAGNGDGKPGGGGHHHDEESAWDKLLHLMGRAKAAEIQKNSSVRGGKAFENGIPPVVTVVPPGEMDDNNDDLGGSGDMIAVVPGTGFESDDDERRRPYEDIASDDDSNKSVHAWSEASAQELATELEAEVPFFTTNLDHGNTKKDAESEKQESRPGSPAFDIERGDVSTLAAAEDSTSGLRKRGSATNLEPITEGKTLVAPLSLQPLTAINTPADDDQLCITSSVGAALKEQLQMHIGSGDHSGLVVRTNSGSKSGGASALMSAFAPNEEDDMYYTSVPAVVGRQMQQELKQTLERRNSNAHLAGLPSISGAGPAAVEESYYSSVPAAAGREMQEQLRAHLEQQQQLKDTQPIIVPSEPPVASPFNSPRETKATGSPASPRRTTDEFTSKESSVQSMPAGVGRAMQAELQRQLRGGAVGSPGDKKDAKSSLKKGAARPPRVGSADNLRNQEQLAARQLSQSSSGSSERKSQRTWDSVTTVTGALGSSLAAELRERVGNQPIPREGVTRGLDRDLLGRKLGASKTLASLSRPSPATPRRGGDVSQAADDASSAFASSNTTMMMQNNLSGSITMPPRGAFHSKSMSRGETQFGGAMNTPLASALWDRRKGALQRSKTGITGASEPASPRGPSSTRANSMTLATAPSGTGSDVPSPGSTGPPLGRPMLARVSGSIKVTSAKETLNSNMDAGASLLARTYSIDASLAAQTGFVRHSRGPSGFADYDDSLAVKNGSVHPSANGQESLDAYDGTADDYDELDFTKEYKRPVPEPNGLLLEMRSRLVAGLKRYYVAKRMAGLLSIQGLRILKYACDKAALDSSQPLTLWKTLEKEIMGGYDTKIASRMLLWAARSYKKLPGWGHKLFGWPFRKFAGQLRRYLGRKMLVACEVAVEYYLSLMSSPQIQFLKASDDCYTLIDEVDQESDVAFKFIISREIEAPDRFQAIQSYRAAMAILRQQLLFVEELYETGMIDNREKSDMIEPLDQKIRHLEIVGPVWKPPRPKDLLRSLPLVAGLPPAAFNRIFEAGELKEVTSGGIIWSSSDEVKESGGLSGPGAFVVLSGVVKRKHLRPDGTTKEWYQGIGGIIGILLATTGSRLPGQEVAIAEGNSLGKGPVVFHLPQSAIAKVHSWAAVDEDMSQLELQLMRMSAAYVVESMENDIIAAVARHMFDLATAAAAAQTNQSSILRAQSLPHVPATLSSGQEHPTDEPRKARVSAVALTPSGGSGLTPSKSVGANLAAMMQRIAQMEFEGDDDDERFDTIYEEDNPPRVTPLSRTKSIGHMVRSPSPTRSSLKRDPSSGGLLGKDIERAVRISIDGGDGHTTGLPHPTQQRRVRTTTEASSATIAAKAMIRQRAPQLAAEITADIRRSLQSALLLKLMPGTVFKQTSHAVLLIGDLVPLEPSSVQASQVLGVSPVPVANAPCSGLNEVEDATNGNNSPTRAQKTKDDAPKLVQGPKVLPWLWYDRQRCNAAACVPMEDHQNWQVGAEGATIIICNTSDGQVPEAYWEALEQNEEANQSADNVMSYPLSFGGAGVNGSGGTNREGGSDGPPSIPSTSEQGSLMGNAAASMGRELTTFMKRLKSNTSRSGRNQI